MASDQTNSPKEKNVKAIFPGFPAVKYSKKISKLNEDELQQSQTRRRRKWKIDHTLATIGIVVNIVLIIFTFLLWESAVSANKSAESASNAAIESANQAAESNRLTNENLRIAREASESNKSFNKDILTVSNRTLEEQVKSLQESQRQFEYTNKPYLQVMCPGHETIFPDREFALTYMIKNFGELPAVILHQYLGVTFCKKSELPLYKADPFKYMRLKKGIERRYLMISKGGSDTFLFDLPLKFPAPAYDAIAKGEICWFFYGHMYYNSPIFKEKVYEYKFVLRLVRDFTGRTAYEIVRSYSILVTDKELTKKLISD